MIDYATDAENQIATLIEAYQSQSRSAALIRLIETLRTAERLITNDPDRGLKAPRHYPSVVSPGILWRKVWHYWIAYRREPLSILAVYFETEDIPARFRPPS